MTLPSQTETPAHEGRRWRWGWVVVLVFVAGIAALGWNLFARERAVRQLREAGFVMELKGEPMRARLWKAARGDWRLFFQPDQWKGQRVWWSLVPEKAGQLRNLDAFAPALKRANPEVLILDGCNALENVDGLKGLPSLKGLSLSGCTSLRNVDGLKELSSLNDLDIRGCTSLQNVDGLKGLASLRHLNLTGCTSLQNVDGLKGLASLQFLVLRECTALQSVDGLKGLTTLRIVALRSCAKLSPEEVAALKAALPNTKIDGP